VLPSARQRSLRKLPCRHSLLQSDIGNATYKGSVSHTLPVGAATAPSWLDLIDYTVVLGRVAL
jgi:hypothetical protein